MGPLHMPSCVALELPQPHMCQCPRGGGVWSAQSRAIITPQHLLQLERAAHHELRELHHFYIHKPYVQQNKTYTKQKQAGVRAPPAAAPRSSPDPSEPLQAESSKTLGRLGLAGSSGEVCRVGLPLPLPPLMPLLLRPPLLPLLPLLLPLPPPLPPLLLPLSLPPLPLRKHSKPPAASPSRSLYRQAEGGRARATARARRLLGAVGHAGGKWEAGGRAAGAGGPAGGQKRARGSQWNTWGGGAERTGRVSGGGGGGRRGAQLAMTMT